MARLARRFLHLENLEDRTTPSTFTVNTNLDPGPAGTESLRMAITSANVGGANTINFASSLMGQTITFSGTALPAITNVAGVTITGLGQTSLTISGSNLFRVFDVAAGGIATITDLTITKGAATTGNGGGIDNNGSLTVMRDTVTGNSASSEGGGIDQEPTATLLSISNSTISANTALGGAGVLLNGAAGSSATISNSTISGNTGGGSNITVFNTNSATTTISGSTISNGNEPGVFVSGSAAGTVNILDDTIMGNSTSAFPGGGVNIISSSPANVNVIDTTIVSNSASGGGGGISQAGTGTLSVFDSTITGNDDTSGFPGVGGGGIDVRGGVPGAPFIMANSVVAGNTSTAAIPGTDVLGDITDVAASGNNFLGSNAGFTPSSASITTGSGNNPMLGTLQNNGGPTMTELPIFGSPLINAGSNTLVPTTVTTDQRGIGRFIGPAAPSSTAPVVDIGSVEFQPQLMVVSGQPNGTAQTYTFNASGVPQAVGSPFTPFPGFSGVVRSVTGDVNGDGALDTIYVTGPGTETMVTVISGKDGSVLVPPYDPFPNPSSPFTGGGFLAAGDFSGTGKADWMVTPDQGGGPRVVIFGLSATSTIPLVSFFGIDNPAFRGGARVAVGDFNGDGTPDLAVAAGFEGGPEVAIFNGLTLFTTQAFLVSDFFAFPESADTLRNGVYLAAGDFDGDGFADLVFGGGPTQGGPRVEVISGKVLTGSGGANAAEAAPITNFFAFDPALRDGVSVAAKFTTGDNRPTLIASSGTGQAPAINAYPAATLTSSNPPASTTFPSFTDPTEPLGVFVG